MTTGWIKTRTDWREVCIVCRYPLRSTEAVRWRPKYGGVADECISDAADVLPEPPADSAVGARQRAYRKLLESVSSEWCSIHIIATRARRLRAGVWPMLEKLRRAGRVELRRVQRTPRTAYWEARKQ